MNSARQGDFFRSVRINYVIHRKDDIFRSFRRKDLNKKFNRHTVCNFRRKLRGYACSKSAQVIGNSNVRNRCNPPSARILIQFRGNRNIVSVDSNLSCNQPLNAGINAGFSKIIAVISTLPLFFPCIEQLVKIIFIQNNVLKNKLFVLTSAESLKKTGKSVPFFTPVIHNFALLKMGTAHFVLLHTLFPAASFFQG